MKNNLFALQQLLKAAIAATDSELAGIQRVYVGDPVIIPEINLPAIAIQPINSQYTQRGSRYTQRENTIELRLVYNQKLYYEKGYSGTIAVGNATWSASALTITATNHGIEAGEAVFIDGCLPAALNGTYRVTSVPNANTLVVLKQVDPGTFVSGGTIRSVDTETVHAVIGAIDRAEYSGSSQEVAATSMAGVVQKNPSLPFTDDTGTKRTSQLATVQSVDYTFSENRGYPSFEVIVTLKAISIGDR